MTQDAEMKKIDEGDEQRFGPRAMLVSGYTEYDAGRIEGLLQQLDIENMPVRLCTKKMIVSTLADAMEMEESGEPLPPEKLPKVIIMGGLTGTELHKILDGFHTTELQRPIFGSCTKSNLSFYVKDLFMELLAEYRAMAQRQRKNIS